MDEDLEGIDDDLDADLEDDSELQDGNQDPK